MESLSMCVCVCARACACVCEYTRKRERERERERERAVLITFQSKHNVGYCSVKRIQTILAGESSYISPVKTSLIVVKKAKKYPTSFYNIVQSHIFVMTNNLSVWPMCEILFG